METQDHNDRAPWPGSWKSWYWLVIAFLALLIFLFYRITEHFR